MTPWEPSEEVYSHGGGGSDGISDMVWGAMIVWAIYWLWKKITRR